MALRARSSGIWRIIVNKNYITVSSGIMNFSGGNDSFFRGDMKKEDASGGSGSIREAGGAFGKREKAAEEQYFRKMQAEQLAKLKEDIGDEIKHHEEQIKHHQAALDRHKKQLDKVQAEK